MNIRCIALFGTPGAGKSTTADILETLCSDGGIVFSRLKLAEPLYKCQAEIYRSAGRPLATFYSQDGELLNFLGTYLRKINPDALVESFHTHFDKLLADFAVRRESSGLIVCDDMRAVDAPSLARLGFTFVRIKAAPEVCMERRVARGDKSMGSVSHPTEQGQHELSAAVEISNDTDVAGLRNQLSIVLKELFD